MLFKLNYQLSYLATANNKYHTEGVNCGRAVEGPAGPTPIPLKCDVF